MPATGDRLALLLAFTLVIVSKSENCLVGDCEEGEGKVQFSEGKPEGKERSYEGQFSESMPHGRGVHKTADGSYKYAGEWKNGDMHGRGTEWTDDGVVWTGTWVYGKRKVEAESEPDPNDVLTEAEVRDLTGDDFDQAAFDAVKSADGTVIAGAYFEDEELPDIREL